MEGIGLSRVLVVEDGLACGTGVVKEWPNKNASWKT